METKNRLAAAETAAIATAAQENDNPDDVDSATVATSAVIASKASETVAAAAQQKNQIDDIASAVAS